MAKRSILTSAFIVLAVLPAPALARTAAVHVDPQFGSSGVVHSAFGPTYRETSFVSVTAQPDGTLLATRQEGSERREQLRRYYPNGTLDTSFVPEGEPSEPKAIDGDGRVLKVINRSLVRLNPDGTPDPTFGVRPYGEVKISDEVSFPIEEIEPLPSGKILVGGAVVVHIPEGFDSPGETRIEEVALARFDQEGRLDAGFGKGGVVKLGDDHGLTGKTLLGLAPRPSEGVTAIILDSPLSPYGKVVGQSGSVIAGLTADGQLDQSYGGSGVVRLEDAIETFHALPDGELLVAGVRWGPELTPYRDVHASDVFINRYTANGQADPDFGDGDGSATADVGAIDLTHAALWATDGSVLLGGSTMETKPSKCMHFRFCHETPLLARFTANGSPDTSFGAGGLLRLDALPAPHGPHMARRGVLALAARPGGGVLAAGGSGTVAFLAALSSSGTLDPSFGGDGIITEADPSPSRSVAHAAAVDSNGRILVAGRTNADVVNGPEDAVFAYAPNGALDRSFGEGGGYVRVPGDDNNLIAVARDNSSFILSGSFGSSITRVTAGGQIDATFGEQGTTSLPVAVRIRHGGEQHRSMLEPSSIAALPSGGLLVAGTARGSESRVFVFRFRVDGTLDPSFGRHGMALLGFGQNLRCAANQMAVQPDGRIVLAGYVNGPKNGSRSEALAVMRLLPNGARDRSFGNMGLIATRFGRRNVASALAVQPNGRILVAGRARVAAGIEELLLRYKPNGQLDRHFAHQGMASSFVPLKPGGFFAQPRQILPLSHRILVLRDDPRHQMVVFSSDGRHRRSFIVARAAEPGNHGIRAPFGAIQDGGLILGWRVFDPRDSFKLQRLRIR